MFKNLKLKPIYNSYENNLVDEFYNPILEKAVKFDRISAYFSAKALAYYSKGLERFVSNNFKYRLIISENISSEDFALIKEGYKLKKEITENLLGKLREEITLDEELGISNLAYLISINVVEIKIAFVKEGIFHDKCGIFEDQENNIICFRGSNNETAAAINKNYESFTVTCNWFLDESGFYEQIINKSKNNFEELWLNNYKDITVISAEEVIMKEILKFNKNEIIVDKSLLHENCLVLDYDNRLVLRIVIDSHEWLTQGIFYKLRLKRYIEFISDNIIFFDEKLSYLDYSIIEDLIKSKTDFLNIDFFVTNRLKNYIDSRNLFIEKRSRLGIDIKNQNENVLDNFQRYSKVVNKNMTRTLREKQMWDSFFMFAMIKSGNFSVPGSGKTSSVLGVYAFLKSKKKINKIIMIGPKNAFGSWVDEFNICFENKERLNLFSIHDSDYKNARDKKRAITLETGNANLLLFNYESVGIYKEEIANLIDSKTLLVFDEVHKIKKIEAGMPGYYAINSLFISKKANYTIALTGTPIPNSYTDIYNFLHLLYKDEYREFFGFDLQTLKYPTDSERFIINEKIQPFFCRTNKKELQVPEVNSDKIIKIEATYFEQKLFEIILAKYKNNRLALFLRLLQLESNPKMLLNSVDLKEFAHILDVEDNIDDIDYIDYSEDVEKLINSIKITSKICICLNQIEELVKQNKKVIVWCIFKDSIKNLSQHLDKKTIRNEYIYGDVQLDDRQDIMERFKRNEIDVLIANPHTLAESVSLHTVCHDAIYFEYSYNLVHLLQSKDRIHRLGLDQDQYTQYYYLQNFFKHQGENFSIDEKIYDRLHEKEQIMIKAIENKELDVFVTLIVAHYSSI